MKNILLSRLVTFITLLFFSSLIFCQAPNLGTAASFALFTTVGAVGSTGISQVIGNVGTGAGAITGFAGLNGSEYNADAVTTQASADLLLAYTQLHNEVPTFFPGPVLGNGQVLDSGVYFLPAASSLNANLTLDAQGDSNAIFIFQIGGAYSTSAGSQVFLVNGALAANVYWVVEGAVPMAAGTIMRGNIIANNGAISLGAGGLLEGRALSTTGAVSIYGSIVAIPPLNLSILPVELLSFTGVCDEGNVLITWSTATKSDNNFFTVERTVEQENWIVVRTVAGAATSTLVHSYTVTDRLPADGVSFYRLKQTDFDGKATYSNVVEMKNCGTGQTGNTTLYPNPTSGRFTLTSTGKDDPIYSIEIFNDLGQKVFASPGLQSKFDLSGYAPGVYIVQIHQDLKTSSQKLLLTKN
jgi:hypothetical protein